MDLVHTHLPQDWFPARCRPTFQITEIDHPHRARRYAEAACDLAGRRALAGQTHRVFEALAEWRLARQQRHLLHSDAALGTLHPIHLNEYCGTECAPKQISHGSLADVARFGELAPAPGTFQLTIPPLAAHPELQCFPSVVDLLSVNPIS